MSNLLKQHFCVNLDAEKVVINSDERYGKNGPHIFGNVGPETESVPSSEEILDGFLAGLSAEEVQVEPQITAEEILADARFEAEGIIADAQAKAAIILDDTHRQAEIVFETKKQEGYEQGAARLQAEFEQKDAALQDEYDKLRQELQTDYEEKLTTLENDMVDILIRVFHKVFNVQFDNKKQILLHLIKDTLLGVDSGKNFTIRVAESNYKFIESHVADIKEKIGNDVNIDVVNDMTLDEEDCIIETETGVFNCGISMVLTNLEKDIRSLCR